MIRLKIQKIQLFNLTPKVTDSSLVTKAACVSVFDCLTMFHVVMCNILNAEFVTCLRTCSFHLSLLMYNYIHTHTKTKFLFDSSCKLQCVGLVRNSKLTF